MGGEQTKIRSYGEIRAASRKLFVNGSFREAPPSGARHSNWRVLPCKPPWPRFFVDPSSSSRSLFLSLPSPYFHCEITCRWKFVRRKRVILHPLIHERRIRCLATSRSFELLEGDDLHEWLFNVWRQILLDYLKNLF